MPDCTHIENDSWDEVSFLPNTPTETFNLLARQIETDFDEIVSPDKPETTLIDTNFGLRVIADLANRHGVATGINGHNTEDQIELLKMIGRGGSGEVWEAHQRDLDRRVAVKRLRPELTNLVSGRMGYELLFQHEAITTGRLEHPSIPPIYFLGRDNRGSPLLVMKLIRGKNWAETIDEDFARLNTSDFLAKHLNILLQVCHGVAFAHSQGIIHRDLKPEQVVLGEFGEVLLTDWALAIPFSEDVSDRAASSDRLRISDKTPVPGSVIGSNPSGTPTYMAPEQTSTDAESLGPWTDIYLLGGILYRLLTKSFPHPGKDSADAFRMARRGFVPELKAAPGRTIPEELGELVESCLKPKPQDRPGSVRLFITSIQSYLAGTRRRTQSIAITEDVAEWLELDATDYEELDRQLDRLAEAGKLWPENPDFQPLRHRVLRRYAELAFQNDDIVLARAQAERLSDGEEKSHLLAVARVREEEKKQAARELERAYAKVTEERNRAEEVMIYLIRDLHENLRRLGRLDLIDQTARKAQAYYDSLNIGTEDNATIHRRALALRNIGEVLEEQGSIEQALGAYREFSRLVELLAGREPENESYLTSLADAHLRIGKVYYEQRHLQEAFDRYGMCITLLEGLVDNSPDQWTARNNLANAYQRMANVCWRLKRIPEAKEYIQSAIKGCEDLIVLEPESKSWPENLSWCLHTLGLIHQEKAEYDEANNAFQRSLVLRQLLADSDTRDAVYQRSLAWCHGSLGENYRLRGNYELSDRSFSQAEEIMRELTREDPTNDKIQREYAWLLGSKGLLLRLRGDLQDASRLYEQSIAIQHRLIKKDPSYQGLMWDLCWNTQMTISSLILLNRLDEAERKLQNFESVIAMLRQEASQQEKLFLIDQVLLFNKAKLLFLRNKGDEALHTWEQQAEVLRDALDEEDDLYIRDLLLQVLIQLGRKVEAEILAPTVIGMRLQNPDTLSMWEDAFRKA